MEDNFGAATLTVDRIERIVPFSLPLSRVADELFRDFRSEHQRPAVGIKTSPGHESRIIPGRNAMHLACSLGWLMRPRGVLPAMDSQPPGNLAFMIIRVWVAPGAKGVGPYPMGGQLAGYVPGEHRSPLPWSWCRPDRPEPRCCVPPVRPRFTMEPAPCLTMMGAAW